VLLRFLSTTIMHLVRNLARKHVLGTGAGHPADDQPDQVQQIPAEQSGIVTKAVRAEVSTEVHRQLDRLRTLMPGSVFDEFDGDEEQDGDEPSDS